MEGFSREQAGFTVISGYSPARKHSGKISQSFLIYSQATPGHKSSITCQLRRRPPSRSQERLYELVAGRF
jgi:hypothetical protein